MLDQASLPKPEESAVELKKRFLRTFEHFLEKCADFDCGFFRFANCSLLIRRTKTLTIDVPPLENSRANRRLEDAQQTSPFRTVTTARITCVLVHVFRSLFVQEPLVDAPRHVADLTEALRIPTSTVAHSVKHSSQRVQPP